MNFFTPSPILIYILKYSLEVLKYWWWIFPPIILFGPLKSLYLWYIRERWSKEMKWILIEIKFPRKIERPFKAMEQIFSNFWVLYDPPNWKEKWLLGHFLISFSLEIVSIEGKIHFLMRIPEALRDMFERPIYSQYPDAEITEVDDYTKDVPQDIPNKDWDLFGWDFQMLRENCYPIKTYAAFFEENPAIKEEKRLSPLAPLLEGMAALGKGEQLWFQIIAKPILGEVPWVAQGKEVIAKLLHRPPKQKERSITGQALEILLSPQPSSPPEKKEELIPPEMKLSPGEREVVSAIERKISKQGFETNIRMIYLGKKDVFFKPRVKIPLNFSASVSAPNLNGFKPWKRTLTRAVKPAFFRDIKIYMRKRKLFRHYVNRWTPLFPYTGGTFVLNTEELATLYHFPSEEAAPAATLERIEARKGGPPPGLPTE
ncbi:hypothetical protein J7J81_02230 [bacterium]|nr:hypothetical protein [bacterium]